KKWSRLWRCSRAPSGSVAGHVDSVALSNARALRSRGVFAARSSGSSRSIRDWVVTFRTPSVPARSAPTSPKPLSIGPSDPDRHHDVRPFLPPSGREWNPTTTTIPRDPRVPARDDTRDACDRARDRPGTDVADDD